MTFDTAKLTSVTVYGPEDIIDKLTADDLTAQIDLSDVGTGTGSMMKSAVVFSEKYNTVWGFGINEIQVTISNS